MLRWSAKTRELIGAAVAVGVLENADPVVARAPLQRFVWIIHRFGNPHSSALVERERDRLDDIGFGGEETERELGRDLNELHRLVDAANGS